MRTALRELLLPRTSPSGPSGKEYKYSSRRCQVCIVGNCRKSLQTYFLRSCGKGLEKGIPALDSLIRLGIVERLFGRWTSQDSHRQDIQRPSQEMSVDPGAHRTVSIFPLKGPFPLGLVRIIIPREALACDCSHPHLRRPDRCRNAVTAVHIANMGSRRHREARSCCRWR